jgi:hypothetical protein
MHARLQEFRNMTVNLLLHPALISRRMPTHSAGEATNPNMTRPSLLQRKAAVNRKTIL